MNGLTTSRVIILMAYLVTVWGLSWPIFKISIAYAPPMLFSGLRIFIGGLLLALVYLPRRDRIHWRACWPIYIGSALLNIILYYGFQALGLVLMPSGLFSVIVYIQPVLVGVLAWQLLGESLSWTKLSGLLLGFIGVGVVSWDKLSGQVALFGVIMALLSALSWALGAIYVKKKGQRVDPIWLAALQCSLGGAAIAGIGSTYESWGSIDWNLPFLLCLAYGSILGISLAWVAYFRLVMAGEASVVASYTFLVPLIAVAGGAALLNEPITLALIAGLFLIIASIYLANRRTGAARNAAAGSATTRNAAG